MIIENISIENFNQKIRPGTDDFQRKKQDGDHGDKHHVRK